jgi:uncharacterized protein
MQDLLTAGALVLVIEGVLYALFPGAMRRAIQMALELPEPVLRRSGLVAAVIGVAIVWLVRR